MAAPTNASTTLNTVGIRESLSDIIHRVSAEETPFISNIGRGGKPKTTYHEWQTEDLAAPDAANAQLEGDDVGTEDAPNLTSRVGNRLQILRKTGVVSATTEEVDKAGRASEMARQKLLKGREAMRDLELRAIGNYGSNVESGGTPRRMGGAMAWLKTNVSRGAGGANGGFSAGNVAAATNGTQRTFTEDQLKAVMASAFDNGGKPSQAYMRSKHKQEFSGFTGIADIRTEAKPSGLTIYGSADFYQSDFGRIAAIPHAYGLTRDVLIADPDMYKLTALRKWKTSPLAKRGDNERFMLIGEYTLECNNEKAHGGIADLL